MYSPQLDGRKFNRLMKIGSIAIFSAFGTELERFLLYNTRILSGIQRMFFLKIIIFYCKKGDFYLWGTSLRAEKITKQSKL